MSEYKAIARKLGLPEEATEQQVLDSITKMATSYTVDVKTIVRELVTLACLKPSQWEWAEAAVRRDPEGFYRLLRTNDNRLARIWARAALDENSDPDDMRYLIRLVLEKEDEIRRAWEHHEAVVEQLHEDLDRARLSATEPPQLAVIESESGPLFPEDGPASS